MGTHGFTNRYSFSPPLFSLSVRLLPLLTTRPMDCILARVQSNTSHATLPPAPAGLDLVEIIICEGLQVSVKFHRFFNITLVVRSRIFRFPITLTFSFF